MANIDLDEAERAMVRFIIETRPGMDAEQIAKLLDLPLLKVVEFTEQLLNEGWADFA